MVWPPSRHVTQFLRLSFCVELLEGLSEQTYAATTFDSSEESDALEESDESDELEEFNEIDNVDESEECEEIDNADESEECNETEGIDESDESEGDSELETDDLMDEEVEESKAEHEPATHDLHHDLPACSLKGSDIKGAGASISAGSYVPPHHRQHHPESLSEAQHRLQKRIKGLLNRYAPRSIIRPPQPYSPILIDAS